MRRMIILFFLGLLMMAAIAVGIGEACGLWGSFHAGVFNQIPGMALTVGGLALIVWSVRSQYTLGKGTPTPRVPTQRLVTQGPYGYSRNPMTLGALLMYLGIGIWIGSGIVIILTLVVFIVLLRFIYIHETRELVERFGNEYVEYQQKTPFLFPRVFPGYKNSQF